MKKLLCMAVFAGFLTTNAQNTFPVPTGNVGIGTLTPSEALEVVGTVKAKFAFFNNSLPDGTIFIDAADRGAQTQLLGAGTDSNGQPLMAFFDFPQSNIDAKATIWFHLEDRNDAARLRFIAQANGATNYKIYNKSQEFVYSLYENSDNVYVQMPKENSYVTIGTNSFNDNGELYNLTVNGKVRAHSVKVYTDWADYVFEEDYNLPTLEEVEKHIKTHGHLKDIPSAAEVEDNGIELGEMNKLLLQKIEELTLYTIELKKEIDELKAKK
ncbi:hypothetical protein [uncultured Psychroserpens sp.]|uniref:hypothetical protein n=1 Tax=uncultured Psychroserpens sp. TaxID=255436 RepID=UPI002613B159|nr:hypothetical protein [uncultured Psychroserpens sp.]